jgi:hypothetical protein
VTLRFVLRDTPTLIDWERLERMLNDRLGRWFQTRLEMTSQSIPTVEGKFRLVDCRIGRRRGVVEALRPDPQSVPAVARRCRGPDRHDHPGKARISGGRGRFRPQAGPA